MSSSFDDLREIWFNRVKDSPYHPEDVTMRVEILYVANRPPLYIWKAYNGDEACRTYYVRGDNRIFSSLEEAHKEMKKMLIENIYD